MASPDFQQIADLARTASGLRMLILFGSQARGEAHPGSDWDFGYLAAREFDPMAFLARLVLLLGTDRIDVVDLDRTNGLLRYRAAAEGKSLFEAREGTFERFSIETISYWCDMGPIIRAGYEEILAGLGRA
jgi:predicted nucleotidyltransferase